jgi:N6-L-threonylcarbamoyladenine synthase
MLERALKESHLPSDFTPSLSPEDKVVIQEILSRENGLAEQLIHFHESNGRPAIDAIAVTSGPGLEPALWVGVNFAKALSHLWHIPVVPTDHMEGHILASIYDEHHLAELRFPAISLLVSGGHTELILMRNWNQYEKVGQTRDDAVGEAFDKVARLLGLPYPGGPEISKLAKTAREMQLPQYAKLPLPMLNSGDLDFSFSGLKTAVRNVVTDKTLSMDDKAALARDFEEVVVTVLIRKLEAAIDEFGIQSVILGGGVSANTYLRAAITALGTATAYPHLGIYIPDPNLSTDNSIMIALAGHAHLAEAQTAEQFVSARADGNRSL